MSDIQNHESLLQRASRHETLGNHSIEAMQLSPIKVLNGKITKLGEIPFAEGRYCEVWVGLLQKGNGRETGRGGADTKKVSVNPTISIPLMLFTAGGLESA